ncbi:hypothetical protein RR48_10630 [Papilio machaon]|uniref:Uncharacterized protein n=1 Tax=Papilio machaon TaxID=76193 RepID=A0A194RRL2_PAPMA|nr:hypothetical protein RR48_10630 [Papilio machaon]
MKELYAVDSTFADLRVELKRVGLLTFPDLTADATKRRNRGQRCAFVWGPLGAVGAQPGSGRPALPFTVSPCVVCVRRTCERRLSVSPLVSPRITARPHMRCEPNN